MLPKTENILFSVHLKMLKQTKSKIKEPELAFWEVFILGMPPRVQCEGFSSLPLEIFVTGSTKELKVYFEMSWGFFVKYLNT